MARYWTSEEVEYLIESWGSISIPTISKNLNRTNSAIIQKAKKLQLGPFLESGGYITLSQLMVCLRGSKSRTSTINQWIDKGLPIIRKKVLHQVVRVVYINEFWSWAEEHRTLIDFSKLEPLILGAEPVWVKIQRSADIEERRYFNQCPWTKSDESKLITLLETYKYSYREISHKLKRTEGAIKRKVIDLGIKARPIKADTHSIWSNDDTKALIDMYNNGHSFSTISIYITKSSQACRGKIERLIKGGVLLPRSKQTK